MKITLSGVCIVILLTMVVILSKLTTFGINSVQRLEAKVDKQFVESVTIDDYFDERIELIESIVIPGVCIKPETATMVRDHQHNVIFSVKTCDGRVITTTKNFGINI